MKIRRWFSSLPLRVRTLFKKKQVEQELDEELSFHLEGKIEELVAQGYSAEEARVMAMKSLGGVERQMERCRDVRAWQWVERLRADMVFGWRQLKKRKVTTAAAVLSLALGIGACTAAFRLVDALLWRPLPIAHAERLYALSSLQFSPQGKPERFDRFSVMQLGEMRAAVKDQAELVGVVAFPVRMDLTYTTDQEMEKAHVEAVDGEVFSTFGLRPTLGRLLTEEDDRTRGAGTYAVLSYDYWKSRFGREPKVIGRTFKMQDRTYVIVGVGPKSFTGTLPGTVTDLFIPKSMWLSGVPLPVWETVRWLQILMVAKPGVPIEPLHERLDAVFHASQIENAKRIQGMSQQWMNHYLNSKLTLEHAPTGVSELQSEYRDALIVLGALAVMLLLIACANVANLMTAQAAARTREMALRVSIGAGRLRLVQLVMIQGTMLALMAAALGALFAWWAAPFVVGRINPPDDPVHLILPADWRVLGFGLLLTLGVTLLFGLVPALRVSAVQPVNALKGGDDLRSRRWTMHGLIGAQVAFCFVVLFLTGLFVTTLRRLTDQPRGFQPEGLILLETHARNPQPRVAWNQVTDRLRSMPGVEAAAIGDPTTNLESYVVDNGEEGLAGYILVSPGWMGTMKIPLIEGRDFRDGDTSLEEVIVNQAYVKKFYGGANPVGRSSKTGTTFSRTIVGLAADATLGSLRGPMPPIRFVPVDGGEIVYDPKTGMKTKGTVPPIGFQTFIVRTRSTAPPALVQMLRQEVQRLQPELHVTNVTTEMDLIRAQTVRERLLAMLAAFFAVVALLLAGIGLYGVLSYSVLQREREFGIRIAVGAPVRNIARLVTAHVFVMVLAGAVAGVALGMASVRYVSTLLYGVKGNDPAMLVVPTAVLLAAALLAALPAVMRASRIDPAIMLRAE